MYRLLFFFSIGFPLLSLGQNSEVVNYDHIYKESIKSVKFTVKGLFLTYPIVDLQSNVQLQLSFDDLDADNKNYSYYFVHCDQNWQPSQLTEMEYLEGFSEERINDFRFSFNTIKTYTHYEVSLPNEYIRWTKSGNYLLIVFNEKTGEPIITRRFVVVENLVQIEPVMRRPAKASKTQTHHEIDFVVNLKQFNVKNPRQEVKATILQNGRWDNAIQELPPLFIRGNQLLYDYQDKIVFPAMKEFRTLDLRTFRSLTQNIASIERLDDVFEIQLYKDKKRFNQPYLFRQDLDGNFVVETFDRANQDLSGDYADVLFLLYSPTEYDEKEIFVTGGFADWEMLPYNKMTYNEMIKCYVAKVRLKQGLIDYGYAVKSSENQFSPNFDEIEGNWQETNNMYTILIYYRPFGERYDRVIGAATLK
ncbi:MAG: DUF5103 domain-containing protein [Bacteroidota bacterium]